MALRSCHAARGCSHGTGNGGGRPQRAVSCALSGSGSGSGNGTSSGSPGTSNRGPKNSHASTSGRGSAAPPAWRWPRGAARLSLAASLSCVPPGSVGGSGGWNGGWGGQGGGGGSDGWAQPGGSGANVLGDVALSEAPEMVEEVVLIDVGGAQWQGVRAGDGPLLQRSASAKAGRAHARAHARTRPRAPGCVPRVQA